MKKKTVLFTAFVMIMLILTGCGNAAGPAKTFLSALKNLDYAGMCKAFEEDMMTEEDFTDMFDEFSEMELADIFKAHAKNIKYTVGKPVVDPDDDTYAEVEVVLSYDDYSAGLKLAMDQFYKEYFEDEEDVVDETRLAELIKEHYTNDTPARKEETVIFYMEKLEEGNKWVLSYDYDMMERVINAITCNLMDTWYDYDYDDSESEAVAPVMDVDGNVIAFVDGSSKWYEQLTDEEIDKVLSANGITRTENTDLSQYDDLITIPEDDIIDFDIDEDWDDEDWDDEDWDDEESDLYDQYMDRIFDVESSGYLLIKNYTINTEDEDEDYYVITGDVYDFDIYKEWLSIINSVPNFAATYPDIYEDLDDGLYCEEMDVYIPKDLAVSGVWPAGSGGSAISGLLNLINSGHDIVYYGEMDDEAEEIYDSCTNF